MLIKRITIAVLTLMLLVAFMRWGTEYIQAYVTDSSNPEKTALVKEIDMVNKTVAKIPKKDTQLTLRLAELEKELEAEGKTIPVSMDSTYVIDSVLELANSCNVSVTPLQTNDWSMKSEHYMVYTLQIQVEGKYDQIADFINRLENELFNNLIIISMDISGGLKTDTKPDSANLQLAIYTEN